MIDIADALAEPRAKRPSSDVMDQLRRSAAATAAIGASGIFASRLAEFHRRQLLDIQRRDTSEERHPTQRDIEQFLRNQTEAERQARAEEDARMVAIRNALRKDAMSDSIVPAPPDVIQDPDGVVRYVRRQDGEMIRIQ